MDSQPLTSSQEILARKVAIALKRMGTHTPDDVREAIERGEIKQFVRGDSVLLATVHDYPQLREANIFLAAGELEEILEIHDSLYVPWVIENGCDRLTAQGRDGWYELGIERGYSAGLVMEKDLSNGRK